MDLKKFIDENKNYQEILKNKQYVLKKRNDLLLIKYKYGKTNFDEPWEKYCKGCIIDINNNKIVCLSPVKSENEILTDFSDSIVENLIDGTMINLFFYKENWIISTRSDIGGKNRWNNMSILNMFKQCCDYDKLCNSLNKKCCYSFVMNHTNIRNISHVNENKITLIEQRDLENLTLNYNFENINCNIVEKIQCNNIEKTVNDLLEKNKDNVDFKGLTIKKNGKRYNFINQIYLKIKNTIAINNDNLLYKYNECLQQNKLKEYVELFPENKKKFTKYDDIYNLMCQDLLSTYHNLFIHKIIEKKDVKYQLNPLIYDIHKIYLTTKKYIDKQTVEEYVKTLDVKRLVFTMKYYL